MKLHVVCDRCSQSEPLVVVDDSSLTVIHDHQDDAWMAISVASQGIDVVLCVKCTVDFVRWVLGEPSQDQQPDQEETPT